MRSAWLPTRSMSFDTFLDVWPNCLLALPTVLATDLTSRSGSLPIERGSVMPRTVERRERRLSTRPATSPAVAAPTATAGPLALLATSLTVPTRPSRRWVLAEPRLAPLPLDREEPLRERELLLRARVDADDFERDEPPEERDEPLRAPPLAERDEPPVLVLDAGLFEPEVFEPELLDALLPCPLREVDLLVAIRDTPSIENDFSLDLGCTHLGTR